MQPWLARHLRFTGLSILLAIAFCVSFLLPAIATIFAAVLFLLGGIYAVLARRRMYMFSIGLQCVLYGLSSLLIVVLT